MRSLARCIMVHGPSFILCCYVCCTVRFSCSSSVSPGPSSLTCCPISTALPPHLLVIHSLVSCPTCRSPQTFLLSYLFFSAALSSILPVPQFDVFFARLLEFKICFFTSLPKLCLLSHVSFNYCLVCCHIFSARVLSAVPCVLQSLSCLLSNPFRPRLVFCPTYPLGRSRPPPLAGGPWRGSL
jgi:hypothetical protein